MEKEIKVFICEDDATSKEIISKYFETGKVTYACTFSADQRNEVVTTLDAIEE